MALTCEIENQVTAMCVCVYRSKIGWTERTSSDCIAVLYAYKVHMFCNIGTYYYAKLCTHPSHLQEWIKLKKGGYFRTSERKEVSWCRDNMLHLNGLKEVAETVRDLSARLARFGIQVLRDLANT